MNTAMKRCAIALAVIFNITPISFAKAEPYFSIPRDGFECLIKNASKYLERGPEIYVKFDICPEPPSLREELEISGAVNVHPTRRASEDGNSEKLPIETNSIVLSAEILTCLRSHRSEILENATLDRVFVLPTACQP